MKIREKVRQIILSRKYHVLAVSVVAFFATNKFSENALLIAFGIFVGGNAIDKGVEAFTKKKGDAE